MSKQFNLLINLIYLLFAFDSLFKISLLGIKLHIGVILILIVNLLSIITRPRFNFDFFRHHFFISYLACIYYLMDYY